MRSGLRFLFPAICSAKTSIHRLTLPVLFFLVSLHWNSFALQSPCHGRPGKSLLVGCPACLRNFLNLFCEMSCSPNQSLFINVTSTKKVSGNLTVDAIDYASDAFGEGMYNSCKDVKFGTMNTLAINFVAGGAQNFTDWYTFIGRQVGPNEPGSPYAINFRPNVAEHQEWFL